MTDTNSRRYAQALDTASELAGCRARFILPRDRIYFDGHSLGPMCHDAQAAIERCGAQWRDEGIYGWFRTDPDWASMGERAGALVAPLVGAAAESVVATGSTTVNQYALMSSFYKPVAGRSVFLTDNLTFPSDIYAAQSQAALVGGEVRMVDADGDSLDERAIIKAMDDSVAVAMFPSVLYRSGQLLDMKVIAAAARERGITIGFDCSHSAGVVPHHFDDWQVDFAFWSGYKYLNGGPGCPAFLYVNRRHFDDGPALAGWWGYEQSRRFDMRAEFEHERAAAGWQISTPPVLSLAPLEAAVAISAEAGIAAIRAQSLAMTSYLMGLLDELGLEVVTPREDDRRGAHVAIRDARAAAMREALLERNVVCDQRPPDILRLAMNPLYNTFEEAWQVTRRLRDILIKK